MKVVMQEALQVLVLGSTELGTGTSRSCSTWRTWGRRRRPWRMRMETHWGGRVWWWWWQPGRWWRCCSRCGSLTPPWSGLGSSWTASEHQSWGMWARRRHLSWRTEAADQVWYNCWSLWGDVWSCRWWWQWQWRHNVQPWKWQTMMKKRMGAFTMNKNNGNGDNTCSNNSNNDMIILSLIRDLYSFNLKSVTGKEFVYDLVRRGVIFDHAILNLPSTALSFLDCFIGLGSR